MRFISGAIMSAVLTASLVSISSSTVQADEVVTPDVQPVDVEATSVPAVAGDAPAILSHEGEEADVVAELPARGTDDFGLVGVTWDPGFDSAGLLVEVRLRSEGVWGAWEELHTEAADEEAGVPGTEPLWVGSADGVSVRVASPTGERPPGLKVSTIDPGTVAEASASTASTAFYSTSTTGLTSVASTSAPTPQPSIILRSAWGAAKNTKCDTPTVVDETRGAVVHHTAGTNSYTQAQSASIVRATQAYHMKSRKWCDIGYNFLVDKYGQIFEGRNGGIDKQVRAAHSGNAAVNTYAMGVSMMGTFSTSAPTEATKDAMVKLIGWRLGTTGTPTTGTYSLGGKTLNRIAGHRDVVGTECPGAAAYAWLGAPGGLRERVATYVTGYSTEISRRAASLGVGKTGALVKAEYAFGSSPGGTKARYKKIDIISSPFGTYSISDYVRSTYNKLSAQSGALGVPTGAIRTTVRKAVRIQRFEDGTIYRIKRGSKVSGIALWGDVEDKYRKLGEADSTLGAPTRTQVKTAGGAQRATFKKGYITLHSSGRVSVTMR
ncbi:MAG: N-acetylmuramoyl-L-alanine amidase [Aeromicrobium sp.]